MKNQKSSTKSKALTLLAIVLGLCTVIAWAAVIFGTIGSIIYGLYEWGGNDMAIGKAAWEAAKVWMVCMGGGFAVGIGGIVGLSAVEKAEG